MIDLLVHGDHASPTGAVTTRGASGAPGHILRYQSGKRGYPPLSNWLFIFVLMHGKLP
jgi:hypothetical protein